MSPKVLVVEYNAKFPYPMSQCMKYDPAHSWKHDDYHGASLGAWVEALETDIGSSAATWLAQMRFLFALTWQVRFALRHPAELYQPARFYLTALRSGHPPSLSFLANHLSGVRRTTQRESVNEAGRNRLHGNYRRGRQRWRLRQAVFAFHLLKEFGRHGHHHERCCRSLRRACWTWVAAPGGPAPSLLDADTGSWDRTSRRT